LNPLLYIMYVSDVPVKPEHKGQVGQFADDLSLWSTSKSREHNYFRLQRTLGDIHVEAWCTRWRIRLNAAKTQLVSFRATAKKRRQRKTAHMTVKSLKLSGQIIKEQTTMTVLGVIFDQRLSYGQHCKDRAAKAVQRVNLMRMLRGQTWGASKRTLLHLYKQYVRPVLEYGAVCSADAKPSHIRRLQLVQNKALRTILRQPWRTKTSDLHQMAALEMVAPRLRRLQEASVDRFGTSKAMESLRLQETLLG